MWGSGHRGKMDFFKKSSKVVPPNIGNIEHWKKSKAFGRKYDITGFDQPRKDIGKTKIHNRLVFVGGKYRKKVKPFVKKTISSNFTASELKEIKNLYIETAGGVEKKWVGQHEGICYPNGKKASVISIKKDYHDSEDTLTHELVHAHRFATGRKVLDRNRDEKETDLETVARLNYSGLQNKRAGYYWYIPEVKGNDEKHKKAQYKDRIGLTGSIKKKLKGKRAIKKIKEYYPKSEIRKAHFSPAENLDRYFLVKLPNGTKIEVHQRYTKGKENLTEIKKSFRKKYGAGIEAWEYRNGKKVRII